MELLSGCIQLLSYIIESEFESEMEKAKLNLSLDITDNSYEPYLILTICISANSPSSCDSKSSMFATCS